MTRDEMDEVFQWLDDGLRSLAHLQLRHPGERNESVLANLGAVADRLRSRPEYWGVLIGAQNWRHTRVGVAAVLLTRETGLFEDLLYRFRQGSWVAPQLAVALGLVHEAVAELEGAIRGPVRKRSPRTPCLSSWGERLPTSSRQGNCSAAPWARAPAFRGRRTTGSCP